MDDERERNRRVVLRSTLCPASPASFAPFPPDRRPAKEDSGTITLPGRRNGMEKGLNNDARRGGDGGGTRGNEERSRRAEGGGMGVTAPLPLPIDYMTTSSKGEREGTPNELTETADGSVLSPSSPRNDMNDAISSRDFLPLFFVKRAAAAGHRGGGGGVSAATARGIRGGCASFAASVYTWE